MIISKKIIAHLLSVIFFAFQQFFPTWGFENYVSNNWVSLASLIVVEDCEIDGGIK